MTQYELVKCPHCESTSIFIHQEDDLCLCGECGEAWEWATKAQAVPEGWMLAPIEPTTDQFGGIARDVIQWMRFTESKNQHSESLVKWLKDMGNEIPEWLYSESEINHLSKHVISKGTIAAIIYKAMLAAAPEQNK